MAQLRLVGRYDSVFSFEKDEKAVELTSAWYYHMRDCVPPIPMPGGGYQVGEPESSDEEGNFLYTPIFKHGGHFFAVRPKRIGYTLGEAMKAVHEYYLELKEKEDAE